VRRLPKFLPTTTVGSFPKPPELLKARSQFARGKMTPDDLAALECKATEFWIRSQEEIGIDLLVDGEQYRGDMVTFFAEQTEGCVISDLVRSYGNRYYRKPIVVGDLKRAAPYTVGWWKFAQSLTERPIAGILTGPYTMMDWSFNEHYPSRGDTALAFARIVRQEVEDLLAAGAKFIQVDEPAISARVDELDLAIQAMHVVTDGVLSEAEFCTHICYGTFEKIYPKMLDLPVHRIDLEMSNSSLRLLDKMRQTPFTKKLGLGVVDVHSHVIESVEDVQGRIEDALTVIPPQRLYVDPDCGLKTRTVDEAVAKMKVIAAGAANVRAKLAKPT
jgi:5-methyltetrahydropteroyltriglutamate--homocysteine methyltransferase